MNQLEQLKAFTTVVADTGCSGTIAASRLAPRAIDNRHKDRMGMTPVSFGCSPVYRRPCADDRAARGGA